MAFEDIERLKEKVDGDPNSKLFIPLAEEYKMAGMFDEAIDVLSKGLERQPGYMSAHVSLGKVYFERGMLEEARAEFEKVASAIPDNLYAHKKLAEIYRGIGEKDKSVKEFKTVLKLNPMDEWAATSLEDLEEGHQPYPEIPDTVRDKVIFRFEPEAGAETAVESEETHEEELMSFEEIFMESEAAVKYKPIEEELPQRRLLKIGDADPYILQAKYMDAMNIYRRILSLEPGNMHVMQRIEELKALLKLLGKDKEELIARLDSFLAGIKKRRDEFYGSP